MRSVASFASHRAWRRLRVACVVVCGLATAAGAQAQAEATLKRDGDWRYALGAGLTRTGGNNDNTSLSVDLNAVRATRREKLDLRGRAFTARSNGETTGEVLALGTRYEREITSYGVFGFGLAEALRDTGANIQSRFTIGNGGGYHIIRTEENTWDVFAGLGYTRDNYIDPTLIDAGLRTSFSRLEVLIGQESTHALSDTTRLRQRWTILPSLDGSGTVRSEFDLTLSVAINNRFSLNSSLIARYNSDPGSATRNLDYSWITALTLKID